jgi:hypothetical protein
MKIHVGCMRRIKTPDPSYPIRLCPRVAISFAASRDGDADPSSICRSRLLSIIVDPVLDSVVPVERVLLLNN